MSWWIVVVCNKDAQYAGTYFVQAKDVQGAMGTPLDDDEYIELIFGPYDEKPAEAFYAGSK